MGAFDCRGTNEIRCDRLPAFWIWSIASLISHGGIKVKISDSMTAAAPAIDSYLYL